MKCATWAHSPVFWARDRLIHNIQAIALAGTFTQMLMKNKIMSSHLQQNRNGLVLKVKFMKSELIPRD